MDIQELQELIEGLQLFEDSYKDVEGMEDIKNALEIVIATQKYEAELLGGYDEPTEVRGN